MSHHQAHAEHPHGLVHGAVDPAILRITWQAWQTVRTGNHEH